MRKLLVDVLEEATARGIVAGVGDRIKQARMEAGLTQDQLSELVGVGMRQIQYYESGESDPYRKLSAISEATGKSMAWLLRGEASPGVPVDLEEVAAEVAALRGEVQRILEIVESLREGHSQAS